MSRHHAKGRTAIRPSRWTACAAGLVVAVSVQACSGANPLDTFKSGPSTFDVTFISATETWDLDRDSVVTCDEWKQYSGSLLQQSDGDGDGALTEAEYQTLSNTDKLFDIAGFKYYDTNSDGKVTADELTGRSNRAFELLDKNKDCRIERDEKVTVRYKDKAKPKDDNHTVDPTKR